MAWYTMAPCAFVYKMADRTEFKSDDRASPKPIFWLWLWATIHTNLAVLKIILSSSIFYSFIFFLLHAAYGTSRLWHVVWLVSLVHFIYKDNKKWKKKKLAILLHCQVGGRQSTGSDDSICSGKNHRKSGTLSTGSSSGCKRMFERYDENCWVY